jgi:N-acylglucosamine 2-epimerase
MPFWLAHGVDREYGGVFTLINDDGTLVSTDKLLWSQGRALWVFSALYNDLGRDLAWLEIADGIAQFLMAHGRDKTGAWVFRLARDGKTVEPPKSIYVDAFALYGLTEYARATGNRRALEIARETYRRTNPLLRDHSCLPTRPHPIPEGYQSHGPSMMFAMVYHELGVLTQDQEILHRALELAEIVMTQHLKPELKILFEFVRPGGGLVDSDVGKTFVPGHAIESMWFMERIYAYHGRPERVRLALEAIKWNLEKGWDPEYGGLFLARHIENGPPHWHSPDSKVWWPITEALYALLRAYELTGDHWFLDWYWKVHEYAFRVFPNSRHGDWFQNLDRQGRRIPVVVKALPVKDPLHLPRALLYSLLVLRRLAFRKVV